MKKIKLTLIILAAVLVVAVCSMVVNPRFFGINIRWPMFSSNAKVTLLQQEDIKADLNIAKVSIDGVSESIVVKRSESDSIIIRYYAPEDYEKLNVTTANGALRVERKSDNAFFNFRWGSRNERIEVELPAKTYDSIYIGSTSGDITADYLNANSVTVSSVSGDSKVTRIESVTTKLESVSGEIEVASIVGDVTANTTSGDVDISAISGSIRAESVSGDMEIRGFSVSAASNIETVSGDIELQMTQDTKFTLKTSTLSGKVVTQHIDHTGNNLPLISMESVSGDIKVRQ